jgi:hypothetical protein
MKRAKATNISLLSIIDPDANHRWRCGFNARTLFLVTLIEDLRLHFDDDTSYFAKHSYINPLCLQVYDGQQRALGNIHDIVLDHFDLPLDECTLVNYPIAENPILIRDVGAASGFRKVFLTCELRIKTEAWIKNVPLLRGKGLYNENSSCVILADTAVFEAFDFSKLRAQWSRVRNLDLLPIESMLTMRAVALNQSLYPISHDCRQGNFDE